MKNKNNKTKRIILMLSNEKNGVHKENDHLLIVSSMLLEESFPVNIN